MVQSPSELQERARARWELEERRARDDLLRFIPWVTPEFASPTPLAPICRVYDRILAGEQVFACIEAPPRHGKSETLHHGVARQLRYRPRTRVAYVTYSQDIADDQSRIAREHAAAAGVVFESAGRARWDPSASVRHWQTDRRGGFVAAGRDGGLVSKGFDLIHFDDPFKNREEAESLTISDKVWEGFRGDIFTRLEPGGSVVVAHQRWNDEDLIARIMREVEASPNFPRFERITLSAIADNGTPLWPERYDLPALAMIRAAVGEYNWWSQFQCRPRPKGGAVFHEPVRYELANLINRTVVIAADIAGTAKTSADLTAIVVAAFWRAPWMSPEGILLPNMLYGDLLRCYTMQLEVPDVVEVLRAVQEAWPGAPIAVETQGGHGKDAAVMLRRLDPGLRLIEVPVSADKFTRAQPAAAGCNQSRFRVPIRHDVSVDHGRIEALLRKLNCWDEGKWIDPYVRELTRFTGREGGKDDRTDATVHAWDLGESVASNLVQVEREPQKPRAARNLGGF